MDLFSRKSTAKRRNFWRAGDPPCGPVVRSLGPVRRAPLELPHLVDCKKKILRRNKRIGNTLIISLGAFHYLLANYGNA
uniref:Uncharacterized protein n=1 Tax=Ascaris lumbricoides TaxID=6252 RepID=A0A0M3HRI6_ASCLU